jgi:type IV secretion system protein VirB10
MSGYGKDENEETGFPYFEDGDAADENTPEYPPEDDADGFDGSAGEEGADAEPVGEDSFSPDLPEGEDGGEGDGPAEFSTGGNDDENLKPYKKKPAGSVIKSSKPSVLNRQLILYIIGGAAIVTLVFATFILPALQTNTKKAGEKKKQAPAAVSPADYYSLVPRTDARNLQSGDGAPSPGDPESPRFWDEDDDEILNNLPPVDERFQDRRETPAGRPAAGGGGGTGYVRPDTRNDRLQAKRIEGIKGITPGQSQYLGGPGQTAAAQPSQERQDPANPYAQFGMPPKEDYMAQMLALQQQQQNYGDYGNGANSYAAQNDQSGKTAFYNRGRENAGNGYWLSPASVWQGTIFEAALTSAINTDLPGECTAMVTKNVYSSQDGKYLLIPQNSRLLGTYNSSISYSQKRVQVGWHTLIRPDGYYVNLGNMQAADARGAAGLPGLINEHPFQYLKAIFLLSAMNIVNSELGYTMADATNQYVQNVMANTQEVANTLGAKIIDRALDVQPTITIKEGTKINVVTNNTLVLPPMKPYPAAYPYRRNWNR